MRNVKIIVSAVLATSFLVAPADASGLLKGLLGGSSGSSSTTTSSSSGGSSSGGTSVGVSGVATASLSSGSSGTSGNATLLGGGGSTINVGLGSIIGGNSNLGVTLPGTGSSSLDNTVAGVTDTVNGITGNGGTVGTLLSDTGLSGPTGGLGGVVGGSGGLLGGSGDGGTGPGTPGGPNGQGNGRSVYGYIVSAGAAACRQDTRGIVQLLQMRYSARSAYQWRHAAGIQVVKVPVCPRIRPSVAQAAKANASLGMLRGVAASDPLISTSLWRARAKADNVLGVAQRNGNLTVYVY